MGQKRYTHLGIPAGHCGPDAPIAIFVAVAPEVFRSLDHVFAIAFRSDTVEGRRGSIVDGCVIAIDPLCGNPLTRTVEEAALRFVEVSLTIRPEGVITGSSNAPFWRDMQNPQNPAALMQKLVEAGAAATEQLAIANGASANGTAPIQNRN